MYIKKIKYEKKILIKQQFSDPLAEPLWAPKGPKGPRLVLKTFAVQKGNNKRQNEILRKLKKKIYLCKSS